MMRRSLLVALGLCLLGSAAAWADWPQWRGPGRAGGSPGVGLLTDGGARRPRLVVPASGLGGGYARVSVVGGRIYTTGNLADAQALICIDEGGKIVWTQKITEVVPKHGHDGSRCTPSIDGERLYAIASSGKIVCLKTDDGSEIWTKDFRSEWGGRMMSGWGF